VSVILELLRGADLESTSRKYRVTVATLTEWRDEFLAHGEAGLTRISHQLSALPTLARNSEGVAKLRTSEKT